MDRRMVLTSGLAAGVVGASAIIPAAGAAKAQGCSGVTFVFAHGSWHGAWCWASVTPHLVAAGHNTMALDLPGHGLHAKFPSSYLKRPLDIEAFAAEPSFMKDIDLDAYVTAVTTAVDQAKAGGAERVIVVGHSMGGVPITFAGEKAAEKIDTLVFLTACMMPPGKPWAEYFGVPSQADAKLGPVLIGDPGKIGGLRWDPRSQDAEYLAAAKAALAHDVDDQVLAAAMNLLSPDAPAAIYGVAPDLTPERFGSLKRVFIKCTEDWTIRPGTQDLMISDLDAAYPDNATTVFEIVSSHEVMLSKPKELADTLLKVVG